MILKNNKHPSHLANRSRMQVLYWENESVLMIGPKGDSLFYSEHKVCLCVCVCVYADGYLCACMQTYINVWLHVFMYLLVRHFTV